MRTEEVNKWVQEGGPLPQDLTQEEKEHLAKLGWSVEEEWYSNGQKWWERHYLYGKKHGKEEYWYDNGQKALEQHFLHGMKHGVFKEWATDGSLTKHEEYYYGNKIK